MKIFQQPFLSVTTSSISFSSFSTALLFSSSFLFFLLLLLLCLFSFGGGDGLLLATTRLFTLLTLLLIFISVFFFGCVISNVQQISQHGVDNLGPILFIKQVKGTATLYFCFFRWILVVGDDVKIGIPVSLNQGVIIKTVASDTHTNTPKVVIQRIPLLFLQS